MLVSLAICKFVKKRSWDKKTFFEVVKTCALGRGPASVNCGQLVAPCYADP